MRKWNKLLAMLLAMVMVLGLTATAFAAGTEGSKDPETAVGETEDDKTAAEGETEDDKAPAEGETEGDKTPAEDDVDYTGVADWALAEVKDVVGERKLIAVRETGLEPAATMTRAEVVAALYALAGSPTVEGENKFTDVDDDASYKNAVIWASSETVGVVNGTGDGTTFSPDDPLTRELIAVFLYRYTKNVAKNDAAVDGDKITGFDDADSVDSWAAEGMNWAVANGLLQGSDNKLDPTGSAQRQMFAVLLSRYIKNILEVANTTEPAEGDTTPAEGEAEGDTTPAEGETEGDAAPAEGETKE